jgi:hypothetical protein
LQFEFLDCCWSFFPLFVLGRVRPFFFFVVVVSSFFSGAGSAVQGFISWGCCWLKLVANGTRLSKKTAAPIAKRLIVLFMTFVWWMSAMAQLIAHAVISHRTPGNSLKQERTTSAAHAC